MKIKNTSKYPIDLIRSVIKFARPSGISNFDVMVKNSNNYVCGRSYGRGSPFHTLSSSPFVVIRIAKGVIKYPYKTYCRPGKGYIQSTLYSDTEALINIIAHELRHLWQKNHKRGRVKGSKGVFSERDADAYAIRKVREYRRVGIQM
jgi:hypothetical protein